MTGARLPARAAAGSRQPENRKTDPDNVPVHRSGSDGADLRQAPFLAKVLTHPGAGWQYNINRKVSRLHKKSSAERFLTALIYRNKGNETKK